MVDDTMTFSMEIVLPGEELEPDYREWFEIEDVVQERRANLLMVKKLGVIRRSWKRLDGLGELSLLSLSSLSIIYYLLSMWGAERP